jgi:SAM-dependent methyltransferase
VHQTTSQWLQQLVVCPLCKARLNFTRSWVRCTACTVKFHQPKQDYIDLLPKDLLPGADSRWAERQDQTEEWYRQLITNPEDADGCFLADYTPYAALLATFNGSILDVGGGNGIVRHFLPTDGVQYVSIDPSTDWLGADWMSIAERFPCLRTKLCFVRGVAEYLPFPPESFDAVLSFWSLNHSIEPERAFQEVHQVLRPGGRFLIVLEDMEPDWADVAQRAVMTRGVRKLTKTLVRKVACSLKILEWPLQRDHIRIRESDIHKWVTRRFEIARREWIADYLTFELRRI